MARFLSLVGGAAGQFFSNVGGVLSGGLLYVYEAGTSDPATAYTNVSGSVVHTNPIVLDSAGRVPGEIWLAYGDTVKFVLKTSAGALIGTWDNVGQSEIEVTGVYGLQELLNEKANAATSAPLESPALTGTPTAPTPATSDESTKIATTKYVIDKIASISSGVVSFNTRSGAVTLNANDVIAALGYSPLNKKSQIFTSNGEFTVPAEITKLVVTVVGAGGGGGSGAKGTTEVISTGGSGGGGGAVVSDLAVEVTPEASIAVTVGTGGAGGAGVAVDGHGNAGQNGGSSSFGSYVTVSGGNGGAYGVPYSNSGDGGSKGTASSGAIGVGNKIYPYLGTNGGDGGGLDTGAPIAGGDVLNRTGGAVGINGSSSSCKGGSGGGASGLADGGAGGNGSSGSTSDGGNGTAGTLGSGGGGGGSKLGGVSGDSGSGGNGGNGYVLVEWDE